MEELYAFMIGKLLGDGTIVKQDGRAPRLSMLHRKEDRMYLDSCHQFLSKYISLSPILYKKSINPKIKKGFSECYYCYSKKNSMIEEFYYLWYPNKKKTLPKAFIERYFNTRSLAIWYQDDGHLKVEKGKARKVVLSTECFTYGEILFLKFLISNKYNIYFRMDKQRRLILYNTKEIMYFLFLVQSYLYPGMDRKNLLNTELTTVCKKKRTTISLPDPIPSEKPTLFINNLFLHIELIQESIYNKNFYCNYYPFLTNRTYNNKYQIIINVESIVKIDDIKQKTGLTYNEIAYLCFLIENKKIAQSD